MSRKICSWLTVIVRLLRGTRQASGGRHFEDFTYHSSLRNAFITFEHFYYPPFRFSANVTDFENWKTRESFSNALWSRAKISKRSTRFYCAPHGRLRGWPNERRGLLPIYFQAVPSGQVFPLTARHASFFERFDDIRYFSRSDRAKSSALKSPPFRRTEFSLIFHFIRLTVGAVAQVKDFDCSRSPCGCKLEATPT